MFTESCSVVPKPIAFEVDFSDGQSKTAAKPKRILVLQLQLINFKSDVKWHKHISVLFGRLLVAKYSLIKF